MVVYTNSKADIFTLNFVHYLVMILYFLQISINFWLTDEVENIINPDVDNGWTTDWFV